MTSSNGNILAICGGNSPQNLGITLMLSTGDCSFYSDVMMGAMASQITGVSMVYSNVCSGADQRKHQSYTSLAFVRGIHRWPVNSPHKGPVTRKMFPLDDVLIFDHFTSRRPYVTMICTFWCIHAPWNVLNYLEYSQKPISVLHVPVFFSLWWSHPRVMCISQIHCCRGHEWGIVCFGA